MTAIIEIHPHRGTIEPDIVSAYTITVEPIAHVPELLNTARKYAQFTAAAAPVSLTATLVFSSFETANAAFDEFRIAQLFRWTNDGAARTHLFAITGSTAMQRAADQGNRWQLTINGTEVDE